MDNDNKSYGYFYTDGSVSFLFYMFALFLCLMMVVCSFGWRPTHGCYLLNLNQIFGMAVDGLKSF